MFRSLVSFKRSTKMMVQVFTAKSGGKKAAIGVRDTEENLNGVNIRDLKKIKLRFGYSVSHQTLIFRRKVLSRPLSEYGIKNRFAQEKADARVASHRMGDKRGTNRSKEQLSDFDKPDEADSCCITNI